MTPRERQILALLAEGLTNAEIGAALGVSENTIKTMLKRAYVRLGARNAPHAVTLTRRHGFLPCDCGQGDTVAIDLDRPCPHEHFDVHANVGRILRDDNDPIPMAYMVELRVTCQQCQEPFRWAGVHAGMSYATPRCSPDETELRAPIRPASADPDFGMGLPGFSIQYRGGGE